MKFRTHHVEVSRKRDRKSDKGYERSNEPSLTIQGETLTIGELLEREMNGLPIGRRPIQYMDVDDIREISPYYRPITDLTDLDELKRHNAALETQINEFEKHLEETKDKDQLELFKDVKEVKEEDSKKLPPAKDATQPEK